MSARIVLHPGDGTEILLRLLAGRRNAWIAECRDHRCCEDGHRTPEAALLHWRTVHAQP